MFIDIHGHAYKKPWPDIDGVNCFPTLAELLKRYDELQIEQGILLPILGPELYSPQSNEEILDIVGESGGRLRAFCNIDPRAMTNSPDAPLDHLLNYYKDQGCLGVGEVMPAMPFSDPLLHNLFRCAQQVGLPILFDATCKLGYGWYGLYDDPGFPGLEACLQSFPNLVFIGHGPGFWAELGQLETPENRHGYPSYKIAAEGTVSKLMRKYPNLYAEFSAGSGYNALSRDVDFAAGFITEFQDKLFFGTDICRPDQHVKQAALLVDMSDKGLISNSAFEKVARNNAKAFFDI